MADDHGMTGELPGAVGWRGPASRNWRWASRAGGCLTWAALAVFPGLVLPGCPEASNESGGSQAGVEPVGATGESRVTLEEAKGLIRDWLFDQNPDLNPTIDFTLRELTTDEAWQRLGVQVFQVSDGVNLNESYLLDTGQVESLGEAFGGQGVDSLCVSDLDSNGTAELVYSFGWGSGIHRSEVGAWAADFPAPQTIAADVAYLGDLTVVCLDDRTVEVRVVGDDGEPADVLGQLALEWSEGLPRLVINLDENLTPEVANQVWR